MSTLFYNGVSIDVLRTVACRRRVVLDGPTYLYSEWFIHVRGILNPSATSYISRVPADAFAIGGSLPAYTDATIRHQLMQPGRKLVYTAAGPGANPGDPPNLDVTEAVEGAAGVGGSLVILETPPPLNPDGPPNFTGGTSGDRYFTDAQNGPFPTIYNVVRVDGIKTIHVEFAVMARVNECFNYYSSPAVLLSHRWTMRHDIDRHGFTRRSVRGHAIFRSDVLLNMKADPDDFRTQLLHPIPGNHERQNIMVEAHEDGLRVDYSFTDVEVSHNIVLSAVAHLECFARILRHRPSLTDLAEKVAPRSLWTFGSAVRGALPTIIVRLTVRAWGNRRSSRATLRNVCTWAIQRKLPSPGGVAGVPAYTLDNETVYDMVGRYVEMSVTMIGGFTEQTDLLVGGASSDDVIFPNLIQEDINGIAVTGEQNGRAGVGFVKTARGTYLESCVAQALQSPCKNPSAPANVGVTERTLPVPGS